MVKSGLCMTGVWKGGWKIKIGIISRKKKSRFRGEASYYILMKDYDAKMYLHFFFGITWTDDSFTVTSEKYIEKVNRVNFDFMLTLMENQTIHVHLKTHEDRQAPFGSVLHSYSSESVENIPSVSYFKDLEKKHCHLLFSQGWNACDEKMMFNSSWPAVRLYYSEPFALACSKTLSMLLMNAFEHKTQRCKKNAICLSVLQCLCSEI